MQIDGRPNPVGYRTELALETFNDTAEGVEESEILPEPELLADVSAPVLPYLTPDAMLVYCQSRLSGINSQCREIMTKQEQNAKAQAAVGDLLTTLYRYQEGGTQDWQKAEITAAYAKAIDGVGGPDTLLGQKLIRERDTILVNGEKNEIASLINGAKNHQSQLNSDAEIGMIRLQSLMSQRQTAIQLTTNIIQSLNDQANKIVANIGH